MPFNPLNLTFLATSDASSISSLAADPLPLMLAAAGVIGITFVLVMSARGRLARQQARVGSVRDRVEAVRRHVADRDELQAMETQFLDTAQTLAAQLDAKAIRLEQLIAIADERLATLRAEVATPAQPPLQSHAQAAVNRPSQVPPDPLHGRVWSLRDEGLPIVEIARSISQPVGTVELILSLREAAEQAPQAAR